MESSYESFLSSVVAPCSESHLPNGLCILSRVLAWLAKVKRMGDTPPPKKKKKFDKAQEGTGAGHGPSALLVVPVAVSSLYP